jgi:hypothetical protein
MPQQPPEPRQQAFTDEVIAAFRRASELWGPAHAKDDSPERDEWLQVSKRLNWTLLGLAPHCCEVENPALDGESFMGPTYGMTIDWKKCQRIRRALIKAATLKVM